MGIERIRGLVLNHSNYSNTSLIVTILTPQQGVLRFMAKGFRKPPKKSYSTREPIERFSEMEFVYYESRSDLHHLSEAMILEPFWGIRSSYNSLLCAGFGAGIALDFSGTLGDNEYLVLHDFWDSLSKGENQANSVIKFWLKQLHASGFLPSFEVCSNCGYAFERKALYSLSCDGLFCERCSNGRAIPMFLGDLKSAQFLLSPDNNSSRLRLEKAMKMRLFYMLRGITIAQTNRVPRLLDQIRKICENAS